jgi:hypothetical protein
MVDSMELHLAVPMVDWRAAKRVDLKEPSWVERMVVNWKPE